MTILNYFQRTVQQYPDKEAVRDETGAYTFAQLQRYALNITEHINNKLSGQRGRPVLVYLPKGKDCIASFLGIIYSGNMYTPTDVKFPFAKTKSILDCLAPSLIITNSASQGKLLDNGVSPQSLLLLDRLSDLPQISAPDLGDCPIDTDPAYVLFTSGSTGVPKGVVITHRAILDYIRWAIDRFGISSKDRIGNQAPFYFDTSTMDIYLSLATGAQMYIIPEKHFSFPVRLMQYVAEHSINFVFWVPSVMNMVANQDVLSHVDCSCLKKVLFAGEVMPNKQLNYWRSNLPDALYANLYGPTEATVACTYYVVDRDFRDDEPLPIGIACENTGIFLLDEDNSYIDCPGKQGEICVRGASLACGYWKLPEKTQEVFIQNPLNSAYPEMIYKTGDIAYYNDRGELLFCGRKDSQIKHMGYRIELGEIETAAMGLHQLEQTCADYDGEQKQIILFYAGTVEPKELRSSLSRTLPKYMVPTVYVHLQELPINDNGKIDRMRLRRERKDGVYS